MMTLLFKLRGLYWRIFKPVILGSFSIVIKDKQVLLVRHTYQTGWFLPGGGIRKGETFQEGGIRELKEECGIVAINPKFQGVYLNQLRGAIDHVAVFVVEDFHGEAKAADPYEIGEAKFFSVSELPPTLKRGHRDRILECLGQKAISLRW